MAIIQKSFSDLVNFTRGSAATYTDAQGNIRTAAIDEPRFTYDPATGEALGLLVEGQATNLFLWSSAFQASYWTKSGAIVEPSTVLAPDGTTATKLIASTGESIHGITRFISPPPGSATFSLFAKAGELSKIQLHSYQSAGPSNPIIVFADLESGEVFQTGSATERFTITPFPDGWWRISGSGPVIEGSAAWNIRLLDDGGNWTFAGDGVSGLYIWGAQLEEGAHPTSYIPTEGGQVTRASDDVIIPTGDWFNPNEGTIYAEIADLRRIGTTAQAFGLFTGGGTTSRLIVELFPTVFLRGGGSLAIAGPSLGAVYSGGKGRVALTYKNGTALLAFNGMVQAGNAPEDLNSITRLSPLSGQAASVNESEGEIANIAYYPRALTDAELQELTS